MNYFLVWFFLINSLTAIISLSFNLKSNLVSNDITLDDQSIYQNISFYLPSMELCVGTPNNQCFNLVISTSSVAILLEESHKRWTRSFPGAFSTKNSSSFSVTGTSIGTMLFDRQMVLAELVRDTVSFPGKASFDKKITLLLLQSKIDYTPPFDGIIGLRKYYSGYNNFDGIEYSFIDYLFNEVKAIAQPVFSLKYNKDGTGRIYFDDVLGEYPRCTSNFAFRIFAFWNCDLIGMDVDGKSIDINKGIVSFDSFKSIVTAPTRSGMKVLNAIAGLLKDKCKIEYDHNFSFLICTKELIIDSMPRLSIKMNGFTLKLNWKHLMKEKLRKGISSYISLFAVENYPKDENNNWVIGVPGFIDNVLIFNRTDGYVGLLPPIIIGGRRAAASIYLMLIIVLMAGIVFIITIKVIK